MKPYSIDLADEEGALVAPSLGCCTAARCFMGPVHDVRLLQRAAAERRPQPGVAIIASRTARSTVESGQRAG